MKCIGHLPDYLRGLILRQTEFLLVMLYSGILLLIDSTYNVAFIDFLSMLKYKYIML